MPLPTRSLDRHPRHRSWVAGIVVALVVGACLAAAPAAQAAAAGTLATASADCAVTDAELTWGFKEAFRSYISSTIANGEWTTADGATYSTPAFSWSGAGSYDGARGQGLLAFPGSVTFTGHGGILNTTIANPQLRFDDAGSATLLLDVTGTTQEGDEVAEQGVEFASIDLGAGGRTLDGPRISFTGAPAALLAPGAKAFGTYEPGEELDPLSVTFTTGAGCEVIASETPSTPGSPAAADLTWLWWPAGGILLLLVIGTAILVARRSSST